MSGHTAHPANKRKVDSMWRFALGIFLAAHGMIHLGYVTPAPTSDPQYPFNLSKSWLVTGLGFDEPALRLIGTLLSLVTIAGYMLAGLAAVGMLVPAQWGLPLTVLSSMTSLLVLIFFWSPWLILGVAIDVVLIAALLWLGWQPFAPAGI